MSGFDLSFKLAQAALLESADRAGIFEALLEKPMRAPELAKHCGVDERALGLVLDALVADELVKRSGDGLFEAGDAVRAFDDAAPGGYRWTSQLWLHLSTFLKTGRPLMQMDGDNQNRSQMYEDIVARLGEAFAPAAASLAQKLGPAPSVLDLGAGSGVWSLAMAALSSDSRVSAVDFPAVLKSFQSRAKALGLEARTECIAGDLHTVEIGRRFHRVVLANVLHLESPDRAQSLIRRALDWLRPDGELVIIGSLMGDNAETTRARSIYSLHLALRTTQGENHNPAELERWCRQAGLTSVRLVGSDMHAIGALVAHRK